MLSPDHFRLTVQLVADKAIFLLDPRGIVLTWNLGAQRIKGYRADEIVGRHFRLLYSEEGVRASRPELALRLAAERGRFQDEGWRLRHDGGLFWARVAITAIHDEQQRLVGFAKVTEDLGARRTARRAPSTATPEADILASVLEHTQEAVVITNVRGVALFASAAAERLLGVAHGFFARRPLINLVARQDTRMFRKWVGELARAAAGTTHSRIVRMRSRAGPVFLTSVHVTCLAAASGPALHWRLAEAGGGDLEPTVTGVGTRSE